jgi:hypothetical protein
MPQYRKKPVIIEALQWDGTWEDAGKIVDFCQGKAFETQPPTGRYLMIHTLEGNMKVCPKDFVIKGVKGEFYPCKPDIFEATYESV